jgi:serpin B
MKANRTTVAAVLSLLAFGAGCGSGGTLPAEGEVVGSTVPRDRPGPVDTGALVSGMNGFGLDYLRLLAQESPEENVVISPLSIAMAFGMAEAGARGATADQIAEVFRFPSQGEELHAAFNALDRKLAGSGKSTLRLANRMYPHIDFPLVDEFVETLAAQYGAPLERLDLQGDSEGSRRRINEWIAERTEGRIEELLKPGFIDPQTVLVLVNALYVEAKWSQPFGKEATAPAPFTRLDGSRVDARLMRNPELATRFVDSPELQAVELPYGDGELSMLVVVPREGGLGELERSLDGATLAGIDERMRTGLVDLALPRWRAHFEVDLLETLELMGLTELENFSGISPENPYLGKGVHAADIEVDEKGTVAAAATALGFKVCACPPPRIDAVIRADRPFFYLIRDTETGTVLFAGRVVDPTA